MKSSNAQKSVTKKAEQTKAREILFHHQALLKRIEREFYLYSELTSTLKGTIKMLARQLKG